MKKERNMDQMHWGVKIAGQLHRFHSNEMNEMKREPNENQTKHHLP